MTLPIVRLTGTPYEQGRQHGLALKDRIAHNLSVYFDRFEREIHLSRADVLDRARRYGAAIEAQNADYYAGLHGVADGSGFSLDELTALQVRYEILYYGFGKEAMAQAEREVDGCTAFAVLPQASESGHLLVGQNWDWIPQVQGAVLHTTDPDGFQTLAFTEAGIVGGKIGLNSAGVALAINGMTSTADDWERLSKPFHVRCYEILRARDFAQAVSVVTDQPRACSTNFLIAQTPDRVVDIEAAPDALRLLGCEGGCLIHTNNFTNPEEIGVTETPSDRRHFSIGRRSRLGELLSAHDRVSVADLQADLRDHVRFPYGLCRHAAIGLEPPESHYITVTSVIMDVEARTMLLTDGVPCENEYQAVSL